MKLQGAAGPGLLRAQAEPVLELVEAIAGSQDLLEVRHEPLVNLPNQCAVLVLGAVEPVGEDRQGLVRFFDERMPERGLEGEGGELEGFRAGSLAETCLDIGLVLRLSRRPAEGADRLIDGPLVGDRAGQVAQFVGIVDLDDLT